MLPHGFPPWGVAGYYTWRNGGLADRIHAILRTDSRTQDGREPTPRPRALDSVTVKTAEARGERGLRRCKSSRAASGTFGLIWAVPVTPADVQDHDAAEPRLGQVKGNLPRLRVICADGVYTALADRVRAACRWLPTKALRPGVGRGYEANPRSSAARIQLAMIHRVARAMVPAWFPEPLSLYRGSCRMSLSVWRRWLPTRSGSSTWPT
jgi:transposase